MHASPTEKYQRQQKSVPCCESKRRLTRRHRGGRAARRSRASGALGREGDAGGRLEEIALREPIDGPAREQGPQSQGDDRKTDIQESRRRGAAPCIDHVL